MASIRNPEGRKLREFTNDINKKRRREGIYKSARLPHYGGKNHSRKARTKERVRHTKLSAGSTCPFVGLGVFGGGQSVGPRCSVE